MGFSDVDRSPHGEKQKGKRGVGKDAKTTTHLGIRGLYNPPTAVGIGSNAQHLHVPTGRESSAAALRYLK